MNNQQMAVLTIILLSGFTTQAADVHLKDPTQPPAVFKAKTQQKLINLTLSEIRITKKIRRAVINGTRLKKGDFIGNYRLDKIEVGYVVLENDKGKRRLNLINKSIIRKKL
jgi:hypothetical protein